jgi:hypothetical protein
MTSFSLDTSETALAYPSTPLPPCPLTRPLRNRWSYGRGYTVIALLAPIVLVSLLLVYLHNATRTHLGLWRLRLWQ